MDLSFGMPTLTRSWFTRASALESGTASSVATAPSGSASVSIGPRQTEALIPTDLTPVADQGPIQEVSGKQQETEQSSLTDQLRDAADKANQYMQKADTFLQFIVSEQTGHVVVHVVNSETKEVVREIPPETLNRIANRTTQMQGLLFETSG
jgi:flagellar protein FlaG